MSQLNQLVSQIEQWAEDRNLIQGSQPKKQLMKLFSEFGELADNTGKVRSVKDDIGDCFVVMTIICKQVGISIKDLYKQAADLEEHQDTDLDKEDLVICIGHAILGASIEFISGVKTDLEEVSSSFQFALFNLNCLAKLSDLSFVECVEHAYNDIKDRKGVCYNGVFIKESDPAYQATLEALGKA